MNILIPDSWLREFLKTDATPKQIKEYLSLCGPSIERVHEEKGDTIYDIEVTGNRPDAMSVSGIAREAAAILPNFHIKATYINDPYKIKKETISKKNKHTLNITLDSTLNPRFTAIVLDNIVLKPSPVWMQERLKKVGMRPINNVVDITNYLMHMYGQPMHTFDFDQILPDKEGIPTMILRSSKKGETLITLDGKTHTLPGNDIVIEDGSGRLIDLCGIMGGGVSHITEKTQRILLFVQTYEPSHIRKTSMALAHRTNASALFEKGLDTELVYPVFQKAIALLKEFAHATVGSQIYDIYKNPYVPQRITVDRTKIDVYVGAHVNDNTLKETLMPLGFLPTIAKKTISVVIPSWRRDVAIDVDVIEEIARMYGYHTIKTKLPDTEPPIVYNEKIFYWEDAIKTRLYDWGYNETYTYSMISEELMDMFSFDKTLTYKITNPLSQEWLYMRPNLIPSILVAIKENLAYTPTLQLFELSMIYAYKKNDIPLEIPTLVIAATGKNFFDLKGISERIFALFGIPYPTEVKKGNEYFHPERSLALSDFGTVGEIHPKYLEALGIRTKVTILELDIQKMLAKSEPKKAYQMLPKFPASYEDIALVVPEYTYIGPIIAAMKKIDPLIVDVSLLDSYENTRTLHITYQAKDKNLTSDDITPVREKILHLAEKKFGATLKI